MVLYFLFIFLSGVHSIFPLTIVHILWVLVLFLVIDYYEKRIKEFVSVNKRQRKALDKYAERVQEFYNK